MWLNKQEIFYGNCRMLVFIINLIRSWIKLRDLPVSASVKAFLGRIN